MPGIRGRWKIKNDKGYDSRRTLELCSLGESATPKDKNATQKANGELISATQKEEDTTQKSKLTTRKPLNATQKRILDYLKRYPKATRKETADALGDITEDGVKFNIGLLQQYGRLKRVNGRKSGEWVVVEAPECEI